MGSCLDTDIDPASLPSQYSIILTCDALLIFLYHIFYFLSICFIFYLAFTFFIYVPIDLYVSV